MYNHIMNVSTQCIIAFLQQSHASIQQKVRGVWDRNKSVFKKMIPSQKTNETRHEGAPQLHQGSAKDFLVGGFNPSEKY